MVYQYNLSDFSNKLLDRIGEIYYGIGQALPANFNTIKQNFEKKNIINSYEKKLESEKGNLGYYDVSISEIVNDFLKSIGSKNNWEIIRKGNSLKLKKIGTPGPSYILYSPTISYSEKVLNLMSLPSKGSDSSRSTTPVSVFDYSSYITPSSSQFTTPSSSQFTTPSSLPRVPSSRGQEVSLNELLDNSNKGGKKRSKRRKTKRRKSRKGKSKRRK